MQPWNTTETLGDLTLDLTTTHGLSVVGHGHDPDQVIAAAKGYLAARGLSRLDAHTLVTVPGAIVEAWWGGEPFGFVAGDWAGGIPQPVTLVNLPPQVVALVAGLEE
jgi:hypothetical protein